MEWYYLNDKDTIKKILNKIDEEYEDSYLIASEIISVSGITKKMFESPECKDEVCKIIKTIVIVNSGRLNLSMCSKIMKEIQEILESSH